jgi:RNA polymerase sigma-70 factor (ECF subfamily)
MPSGLAADARPDAGPAGDADEGGLVAAAQGGDRAAFATLVGRHQSRVRRQLRHALRHHDAVADDLAQDTFVLAWRALPSFRGESRLATWLHRIAHRRLLMHWRAEANRSGDPAALGALDAASDGDADALSGDAAAVAGPDAVGSQQATADVTDPALALDVRRALEALPEAQRTALFHCFQLDLSHEEAAEVLGWPLGTLKSHVARGKAALRVRLAAWAPRGTKQGLTG